ncbi:hypothetical protein, partial [Streptosporangium sp. NPDC003464]
MAVRPRTASSADLRAARPGFHTVSRYISGKEHDSDTWLELYSRIHAPLKGDGIASVRLDHFG